MKNDDEVLLREQTKILHQRKDAANRALMADRLGDLLERTLLNPVSPVGDELQETISEIMALILNEKNSEARESLLHALVNASSLARARRKYFDPEPLVSVLDHFNEAELEYVLYIVGFSEEDKYQPIIEQFLNSPNSALQIVARQALRELKGSAEPGGR